MSRSSRSDLSRSADALDALAALVRQGHPLPAALERWAESCPDKCLHLVVPIARRVRLGSDPLEALPPVAAELGSSLGPLVDAHRRGARVAAADLDAAAAGLRRHAEDSAVRDAAAAGAQLSARMVVVLPLAFLVLVPAAGSLRWDPLGASSTAAGCALAALGMRWLRRLQPKGPSDPPEVSVALTVASLCEGGLPLTDALHVAAAHSESPAARAASNAVRLGASWPVALRAAGPGWTELGGRIRQAGDVGYGHARLLHGFAIERRRGARQEFERELRRAPVLMVLPLVLCILPSFGLIALGPFLRSLLS